jgi:DNA-binding transcriptional ArsR family regulator
MATSTFDALAQPNRRRILDLLRVQPRSVGDLVAALSISQPGTSKHLRVLLDAGLVTAHQDAQRRVYSVRAQPLAAVAAWLEPYEQLWAEHLDRLEQLLDGREETP